MKTMRKVLALFLSAALCATMSVSAFAAEPQPERGVTEKTYTFGDVIVTVVKAPNEITPMPLGFDRVINALAEPRASHAFTLENGEGQRCGAHVWNDAEDDTMLEASFSFTIGNESESLPSEMVEPGTNVNFNIESTNGEDLVGRTVTTIEAVNSDSVRYTYTIEQQ